MLKWFPQGCSQQFTVNHSYEFLGRAGRCHVWPLFYRVLYLSCWEQPCSLGGNAKETCEEFQHVTTNYCTELATFGIRCRRLMIVGPPIFDALCSIGHGQYVGPLVPCWFPYPWPSSQDMGLEAASFLDPSSELRWLATAGIQALQVGTLQQNLMNIWGNGWRMETLGLKVETHTVESWKSSWFSGKVFPKTSPLLMAIVKQLGNPPVRQKKLLRQEKTLLRTGKTL